MTYREFHALAHTYDGAVVSEARDILKAYLEQNYSGVKVYIAEPHGGYVFLCARYRPNKSHPREDDQAFWVEVVDGKCGQLHWGPSQYRRSVYGKGDAEHD